MEVGDLISLYRKQAGLTIDELSEKSGVPKGTLNKIIGGVTKAPTLQNMKSIAKALGKTLADFDDLPIPRECDEITTNKPRITIVLNDEVLEAIRDFQFTHRMKDQSQAVLMLIEEGLDAMREEQKARNEVFSGLEPTEREVIENFRMLNAEGKAKTQDYLSDLVATGRYKKLNIFSDSA